QLYTRSLHDALPICRRGGGGAGAGRPAGAAEGWSQSEGEPMTEPTPGGWDPCPAGELGRLAAWLTFRRRLRTAAAVGLVLLTVRSEEHTSELQSQSK